MPYRLYQKQAIDLVLLDIMMPDISGLQVLSTLRRRFNKSELPVILVSALSERDNIVEGLRVGANDYITKPIEPQITKARITTQLELKALVDERLQLVTKLEDANHMRNRLMKMASHDLKNPINSINMALRIIEETGKAETSVMGMARKSIRQMQSIVIEFLDMDILKDEKVAVELRTVSIKEMLQDMVDTFAFMADEKQIRVNCHAVDGYMTADKKRLQQVLHNLMSNAIKYSPRGRNVVVDVEDRDETVRIHIVDEGAGISKDEQKQLFQPFAKISTTPTAGEDSTGLGLWIARQMMELQGGSIGLYSDAGAGCDFWIELPVANATTYRNPALDDTIPIPEELLVG